MADKSAFYRSSERNPISVEDARALVARHSTRLNLSETVLLSEARGRVCRNNITASFSLPHFRQSSVDGYGVADSRLSEWQIIGENRATKNCCTTLMPGCAAKIYTGSLVPDGVDAIAMKEYAAIDGNTLTVSRPLNGHEHIREIGSHILKGDLVLEAGTRLNPASVGMLAGMGNERVEVTTLPRITIIITGDELSRSHSPRADGTDLPLGAVYEANSFLLRSAIESVGYTLANPIRFLDDALTTSTRAINDLAALSDVIIFSGGMSVGEFDFGAQALQDAGGSIVFHRIAQRPGKPLLMGKIDDTLFFGLPGNPVSALVCFYEYVLPALRLLEGHAKPALRTQMMRLSAPIKKNKDLHYFLRGYVDDEWVKPLEGQLSYQMLSLAKADVLISVPAGVSEVPEGALVEIHFLPTGN